MNDEIKIYDCPDCLKNKRIISLDIETTGLDQRYNTIIELGCIEMKQGKIIREYSKLFGGGHSPVHLVHKVHHIKDSERIGKKTFKQCAEKIASYLSDAVIVTHNGNGFDIPFIKGKLEEAGYSISNAKYLDTYQMSKKIGHDSNALGKLCKEYHLQYGGESGDKAHRGLEDAYACLQLLFCFITEKKIVNLNI